MVAYLLVRPSQLTFLGFKTIIDLFCCGLVKVIAMCLAIPAKVVSVEGDKAWVDFGEGVLREVNITLVNAKVGDYVLVHAGYAIQVLSEEEALETLRLWDEILEAEAEIRKK